MGPSTAAVAALDPAPDVVDVVDAVPVAVLAAAGAKSSIARTSPAGTSSVSSMAGPPATGEETVTLAGREPGSYTRKATARLVVPSPGVSTH
jgi:hypothetical protein